MKLLEILQSSLSQQSWKLQYHEVRMARYCWPNRGRLQPGKVGAVKPGRSLEPRGRWTLSPCNQAEQFLSLSSLQRYSSLLFPGPSSHLAGEWAGVGTPNFELGDALVRSAAPSKVQLTPQMCLKPCATSPRPAHEFAVRQGGEQQLVMVLPPTCFDFQDHVTTDTPGASPFFRQTPM